MSDGQEEAPPPAPEEGSEPPAGETPEGEANPEKKVVVNEEPQVFELDPNSTDVKPVEKPPPGAPAEAKPPEPCPPPIDPKHLEQIFADTLDIIDKTQKQSYDQKLNSQKLAFMLACIKESICLYGHFLEKVNTFLVNNERLQSMWFCKFRNSLRCYEDYTQVLKESPDPIRVDCLPNPVPEKDLKALADQVVDALYAGSSEVSAERTICSSINDKLDPKREFIKEHTAPFDSWFLLLNMAADKQNQMLDMLFKLSAQISFLKTGEECKSLDVMATELEKELGSLDNPVKS